MATINSIGSTIPIEATKGGMGQASFTANGIIAADSLSVLQSRTGTNGQLFLGDGTNGPQFGTVTSSLSTLTLTTGANSLDIEVVNWVDKTAWTPVLSFGGGSTGITYTTQTGTYLRVVNMIYFTMEIVLSSKGTDVGVASIAGLPVSAVALDFVPHIYYSNMTFTGYLIPKIAASGTALTLWQSTTGGAVAQIDDTFFGNTSQIIISGTYFV